MEDSNVAKFMQKLQHNSTGSGEANRLKRKRPRLSDVNTSHELEPMPGQMYPREDSARAEWLRYAAKSTNEEIIGDIERDENKGKQDTATPQMYDRDKKGAYFYR